MKRLFVLLSVLFFTKAGEFLWPLRPFTALTSTFYEYRTTHFHSGVDLSTFRKTGLPVRAAASGEVFRIFYHWYGFGRAIYIRHPGGYVTVYGHLSRFENKKLHLEDLVKRVAKSTGMRYLGNYYLEKPIPVKAGQIIGYSGSMGIGGPHLHFEIRKGELHPLNPLDFLQAKEGRVVLSRYVLEVASAGSFVGLKPTRFFGKFPEKRLIPVSGCFRVFLQAYEKCRGRCGPYEIEASFDGKKVFSLKAQGFYFRDNYMAGRIFNLDLSSSKTPFYVIPDFSSPPLCVNQGKHILRISAGNRHGEVSGASLRFQYLPPPTSEKFPQRCCLQVLRGKRWVKVQGNLPEGNYHYRFRAKYGGFSSPWILLYHGEVLPAGEGIKPEMVEAHVGWVKIHFPAGSLLSPLFCDGECFAVVSSAEKARIISQGFSFPLITRGSGVRVDYPGGFPGVSGPEVSPVKNLSLPEDLEPLSGFFLITPREVLLREPARVSFPLSEKDFDRRVGIYRRFSRGWSYLKPVFREGWISSRTRIFGIFVVARDVLPPKIGRVRIGGGFVRVRIKDKGSGVNPEKIYFIVGGKKIIPEYDYDAGLAFYRVKFRKGKSLFTVEAEDFAGNKSSRSLWIRIK